MGPTSARTPKTSVLIVEDDTDIRDAITDALFEEGYSVHAASELGAARRCLGEHAIDLIVLDVLLENGDYGGELLVDLIEQTDRPAVVLLSASPELAVPMAQRFGLAWVPKPFDFDVLSRVLRVALETKMRPQPAPISTRDLSVVRRVGT